MRSRRRLPLAVAIIVVIGLAIAQSSRASIIVLPPGTPSGLAVSPDDEGAYISWSAPSSNGGSPIVGYKVVASTGASIFAPCAQCLSVYFSGLRNGSTYEFSVYAYNGKYYSSVPASNHWVTPHATLEYQDSAVQDPTATATGQAVTVSWQPPATTYGLAIDRYLIEAQDLTIQGASGSAYEAATAYACGSCTTTTFDGLSNGDRYAFVIYPHNQGPPSGVPSYGRPATTNPVTFTDLECPPSETCVTVDSNSPGSVMDHGADGFMHSVDFTASTAGLTPREYVGPPPSLVQALSPRSWRVNGCTSPTGFYAPECQWVAENTGASLTDVLSDDYQGGWSSSAAGGAIPPWECWPCYSSAVRSIVTGRDSSASPGSLGKPLPSASVFWDLQNEPPGFGLGPNQGGNTALYLQQLSQAYAAVHSVAPSAQIVAPSLSSFVDTSILGDEDGRNDPQVVGFDSVLPFFAKGSIPLEALSWHEDGGLAADEPQIVQDHVDEVKYLESEYGLSTGTAIFVNEYDPQFANLVPGWSAGWIAALENAGVQQADRACWAEGSGTAAYDECGTSGVGGTLDGLFTSQHDPHPFSPDANYWVYRFYADMSGTIVPITSSTDAVSGLAARNDSTEVVDVLLGRHRSCTPDVNSDCNAQNAPSLYALPDPGPARVNVTVDYPYAVGSVIASVEDIPNVRGAVAQPSPTTEALPVTNGQVTITIPTFTDGDAYTIQLAPNS